MCQSNVNVTPQKSNPSQKKMEGRQTKMLNERDGRVAGKVLRCQNHISTAARLRPVLMARLEIGKVWLVRPFWRYVNENFKMMSA